MSDRTRWSIFVALFDQSPRTWLPPRLLI